MFENRIEVELADVMGEGGPTKGVISITPQGVLFSFEGYGDLCGGGEVVLVESRRGTPHVVVWGSINREDPTAVISLAGAAESLREAECEECGGPMEEAPLEKEGMKFCSDGCWHEDDGRRRDAAVMAQEYRDEGE